MMFVGIYVVLVVTDVSIGDWIEWKVFRLDKGFPSYIVQKGHIS